MNKVINLKRTVYELSKDSPELIDIMVELGFKDIVTPGMINTAGRFMTIPKGASIKGIDLETIKVTLINKGYEIIE